MAALSKRDIEMIFRAETDAAQRPVNELSSEVKRLRTTLEDLAKSSNKTDKSLDELASTTRELEKAQEELANSRTLLTQLNSQASALERAEEAAAKASKRYEDLQKDVAATEAPTKRLTNSMEAAERRMNAANQRLEEQRNTYKEVKASIESIIGPVDNLQDAFRTVAVAQRDVSQGLAAAKGNVAAFKAEISDTATEAARLAQVDAFRKFAADSIAADAAADRIKNSLDGSTTSAQRLQDAIFGIVNPAQASANTLAGMDERLDAVIAKMAGGKISVNEWNHLNNELQAVQAGLIRASAEVDKFTAQQARVDDTAGAYDRQAQKVRELAATQVTAETDVKALTAELAREESQLNQLGGALDRETAKLREFGNALKQVGVDSKQLPQAIQRIEATAGRAAPAIKRVSDTISPSGKKGFLGLDPYQLQNLSYQVNDVFTSLGSGAPPLQVLAQQGGQILQIFPGILSTFARFLPIIGPLAIGFTVLAGSISEANTQIQTLRTANTVLASLGETNGYDTKKFQQIVEDFRAIGASAEEATDSAKIFVTEGLNPAAVDDYIIAAKNLATVQRIDLKDATEELTKAFTGGADEVIALDDKYHFLTDTQRENLIASKDTKNEYNEVNKAFTALYNKMQAGANAAKGPMTDATNTLRGAWRSLLQTFADTGILEDVSRYIAELVVGFSYLINIAKRTSQFFGKLNDALSNNDNPITRGRAIYDVLKNQPNILDQAEADTYDQMGKAQASYTRVQTAADVDAGAGSRGRQKEKEDQSEKDRKQAAKDAKKAAREAETESKKRQREAEQLARQYENEQDQLTAALSRFTVEAIRGTQAPLTQQLELAKESVDAQFAAIEDRLREFREKFGSSKPINGMSQADFAAAVEAQKAQILLARQLGVYESNINDLIKVRSERLKAIQEDLKTGVITSQQALDRTYEVTSNLAPAITAAVTAAREFISALTPSAETQALLAKLDRVQNQSGPEGSNTILRSQAQTGVKQNEDTLNAVFERRARLIEAANNLYEAGVFTYEQREEHIRLAYETTRAEIEKGIEAARAYLEANSHMFPPDVLSNARAQLELYNSQLKYTSELTREVKQTAEQAISGGIMNMFDSLAKGIANVITGAGSLKDVFSSLGRAALQFAADFLKSIAQAIIQLYALKIAKSLVGGFHSGGTVGDYGSGQMKLARRIGPSIDVSAVPKYHQGTAGAGLKPNETLAVLEKGEKVQTAEQQKLEKRRLEVAKQAGGRTLKQVLAFGDDQIAGAMAGPAGEDVTITHIRKNAPLISQLLRKQL